MPRSTSTPSASNSGSFSPAHRGSPYARPKKLTALDMRKRRLYTNMAKPLMQRNYVGCDCAGACMPATCACLRDKAPCRLSCKCGPTCAHQIPPCECKSTACDKNCPCFGFYYQCSGACVCGGECLDLDHFPKTEVRISKLPSAGLGLFAAEDIKKGTVIGVFEGEVEPNVDESSHDCFEIAEGISLRCNKMGVYYANEQRDRKANARFRYLEGKRRREMIIIAKTDIKKGGEITTQYSNPNTPPCFDISQPKVGTYALIKGQGDNGFEKWVGKIIKKTAHTITMHWLISKNDLDWLPPKLRRSVKLKEGEHLMTEGWIETHDYETFIQGVHVHEEQPEILNTNTWWWTRKYDEINQEILDPNNPNWVKRRRRKGG